ncbi:hypothetical protein EJ02DRAFT_388315, partial [Clathrospora elynae]
DDDIHNFDETGFIVGVAITSKVVTSSDTVGRAVTVLLCNRDRQRRRSGAAGRPQQAVCHRSRCEC